MKFHEDFLNLQKYYEQWVLQKNYEHLVAPSFAA